MGGQVLSWLGDGIFVLAVPWLVYDLTHSALAVSASYTLSLAPRLLQPFLGALIDRVNPRNWLIASPGVQALLVLGLVAAYSIRNWGYNNFVQPQARVIRQNALN
jgi:MFS family permease